MKCEFVRAWMVAALMASLLSAPIAHGQNADARGIVVDSNGKIYQANYLCDINPECSSPLIQITNTRVKKGSAVAIGTVTPFMPENYVFVGNGGKKDKIVLLVEPAPGATPWTSTSFDNDGADAMVVTRNIGTLYVARSGGVVDVYRRDDAGEPAGYDTTVDRSFAVTYPGAGTCSKIVGIEEWPKNSGDLLVACDSPRGLVHVDMPAGGADGDPLGFSAVIPAGSLGRKLAAVGVSSVSVDLAVDPSGVRDFALVVAKPKEVLAIDLANPASVQRNLHIGSGQVRDLTTGLCFRDPNNESDGDEDVDETCFAIVQSGNSGKTFYIELEQASPGSTTLSANVVDSIDGALNNTYGVDLVNTGTELSGNCRAPDDCQLANNTVTHFLENVGNEEIISFETQGTFVDPRYNSGTGICDRDASGAFIGERVALPLGFTGIPVLKDAFIGPEFCARNGTFFVDVLSAPAVQPTSGFTEYETPGECWMPGFGETLGLPSASLDNVEYGLLFGDPFDLLRNDGTNDPIDPDTESYADDYVTNEFAQDNLIGCTNPRIRAGGRFTFVVEDFVGNALLGDLGMQHTPPTLPLNDNVLYQYGLREGVQRIEIPVLSPQSGCFDDFNGGTPSDACKNHVVSMQAGLAGWDLQRKTGSAEILTAGDDLFGLGGLSASTISLPGQLDGLDLTITASDGHTFSYKNVSTPGSDGKVLGIAQGTGGEIDVNQSISFAVTETPLTSGTDLFTRLDDDISTDVGVPIAVSQLTLALLFDGPEFGDVQEAVELRAMLVDGTTWTATLVNLFEPNGDPDVFGWSIVTDGLPVPAALQTLDFDVLSGDDSGSEEAIVRINDPFGGQGVLTLEVAPVIGSCGSGGCGNQSDVSVFDIGISGVDRVQALTFAYRNYLRALCNVSSRDDYDDGDGPGNETRPRICNTESIAAETFEFNSLAVPPMPGMMVERNIAGYQQADLESALRFIAHNICELDFDTTADPGGIGFGMSESFCTVPPEWAPQPSAP